MTVDSTDYDSTLDLCRSLHRRIVLAVLAEERRPLTVHDLVKAILKHNDRTSITEVSNEAVTEVSHALHHVHLPKLESAGVVEYEPERELVEPTEEFDKLEPYLSELLALDPHIKRSVTL